MTASQIGGALSIRALVLVGVIGASVHLDWHLARPGPHRFSFDLSYHWLFAIPVFIGVTWYAVRTWPKRPIIAVLAILISGLLLGQALEPAGEMLLSGLDWSAVMPPLRVAAFQQFLGAGVVASTVTLVVLLRSPARQR